MTEKINWRNQLLYAAPGAFALLFVGPSFYVSSLDQPIRKSIDSKKNQLQYWSSMYDLGFKTMPILVICGSIAAIGAYIKTKQNLWLYGATTFFSIIPFTFGALMPTNNKLKQILAETGNEVDQSKTSQVAEGMKKWAKLNRVRGLLALGAAGIFFVAKVLVKSSN